jgi:hypothetical protein
MRFRPNQTLFAVQFTNPGDLEGKTTLHHFHQPLMYNDELPIKSNFVKLLVAEHHLVYDEYEDRTKKPAEHNGYLLRGEDGWMFANQYPTASYGQMSDEANRRFNRQLDLPDTNGREALNKFMAENPNTIYSYHLLNDVLEKMVKGIHDLSKHGPDHPRYQDIQKKIGLLKQLNQRIIEEFTQAYPTYRIEVTWRPLFKDDEISAIDTPEVTIYRHVSNSDFKASVPAEVLADLMSFGRYEIELPSGDRLRLQHTEQLGAVLKELNDYECYRLCYLEKISDDNTCPEAPTVYNVHQPEFFHLEDVSLAVQALFKRFYSQRPLRAVNMGVSEEAVMVRQSLAKMKAGAPKYLVNNLKKDKHLTVKYAQGVKYTLKEIEEGVYGLEYSYPANQNPKEKIFFDIISLLGSIPPEVAVRCFLKLIDNPPKIINDARPLMMDVEEEMAAETEKE